MAEKQNAGPTRASGRDRQLVPLQVLELWTDALRRWIAADPREAVASTHLPDVAASLVDAIRLAILERPTDHHEAEAIAVLLRHLLQVDIPALLDRTQGRAHGRLLLALARAVMEVPSEPPYAMGKSSARSAVQTIVRREPDARGDVRLWMWRTGQGRRPRWRLVRDLFDIEPSRVAGRSDVPATLPLGLFDAADASALEESERIRQDVRGVLRRVVPQVTDKFLVEVLIDQSPVSYVQGLVEDDGALFLEVGNPSLLDIPGAPDRLADLLELGWRAPEEDLPNPWRVVETDELDPDSISRLLVRAMEVAHDAFTDLPIDAELSISPAPLGVTALGEDAAVVSADFGDGGPEQRTLELDAANDPIPTAVLELWADAIPNGLQQKVAASRGLLVDAATTLIGAVALRQRLDLTAESEPETALYDLIARMTGLVLPAAARPVPRTKRALPKKR